MYWNLKELKYKMEMITNCVEIREATSDRITLGVTAVLTLSAISLDSRSDLPKVHH